MRKKRDIEDVENSDLLKKVSEGDLTAIWNIWMKYTGSINNVCGYMLREYPAEVDDAMGATLETVVRRLPKHAGLIYSLEAWLVSVARNQCLDRLRAISKERSRHSAQEDIEENDWPEVSGMESRGPAFSCQQEQIGRTVEIALEALPREQKEAFILRHVQGYRYDEICLRMSISECNARKRVQQARGKLQRSLRIRGIEKYG